MNTWSSTALAALAFLVLGVATGCQSQGLSFECKPACPAGSTCTAAGCVLDNPVEVDMTAPSGDMVAGCTPACSGATPICKNGTCVACNNDGDCPIGQLCKVSGALGLTLCAPGCTDDSRCGGGSRKCCAGNCTDVGSDPGNCGACGTACMIGHGAASCRAGQCTLGACAAGWADCNADPADGCEVNLRADAQNCIACGMACALPHAFTGCSGGCYIRACDFGWGDCNGDPMDGCEANVVSDAKNCGACAAVCPPAAKARVACINALCQLTSCDPGFADCDVTAPNGCEINLNTDGNNCGACGNKCGQGLVCIQGACTCPNCNLPNAKAACVNFQCAVGMCNQGYGDCDAEPKNGCERNLLTDPNHCGSCGIQCAQGLVCTNGGCTCPQCNFANGISRCENNMCILAGCLPGFGDCNNNPADGCEVDLSKNPSHCGGCGKACPMNQPFCMNSMCLMGCLMGRPEPKACDGGADRSGKRWVVCTADCNTAWISHADQGGGLYHPLDVCQSLGYSDWSGWDGTFGSICGTNNPGSSCMMPGMPSFKRDKNAPNMPADMWGPAIGNTVEWQCVR